MSAHEDSEVRFAQAIVKLLRYFNLIDTNVGLCLSRLTNPTNPEASYERLGNQTSQQRFEELRARVAEGIGFPKVVDSEEFGQWLSDATRARSIRNRYVHGNWEYLSLRTECPVGVNAPPWMKPKLGSLTQETMTLEKLEAVADEMEQIFNRFMKIRQRHRI